MLPFFLPVLRVKDVSFQEGACRRTRGAGAKASRARGTRKARVKAVREETKRLEHAEEEDWRTWRTVRERLRVIEMRE